MSTLYHTLTRADKILFSILLLFTLLSFSLSRFFRHQGAIALVQSRGVDYAKLYLNEPASYDIPGRLGTSRIIVENHRIYFQSSPCHDKLCIHSGAARLQGDVLVCVPNQVVIRIPGDTDKNLDLITY